MKGDTHNSNVMWVASGTSGERIYFHTQQYIDEGENPKQLGYGCKDIIVAKGGNTDNPIMIESKDGTAKWLVYPADPGAFGKKYEENFRKVFGRNVVYVGEDALEFYEVDKT
jgi:hypothetical protein